MLDIGDVIVGEETGDGGGMRCIGGRLLLALAAPATLRLVLALLRSMTLLTAFSNSAASVSLEKLRPTGQLSPLKL